MSAHTPGPWEISPPWSGFSKITGANGELIFGLAAGSAEEKRSDEECEANALLIAAAPDLLKFLVAWVESTDLSEQTGSMRPVYLGARAAIAKAKGDRS